MPSSPYQAFAPILSNDLIGWLRQLDEQTYEHPLLDASHQRLGVYFEDLVAYYLSQRPGARISNLRRNLALRQPIPGNKGVETVGELDFLFEQGGRIQHLEVAVKFYLGVGKAENRRWLGPNSKDRLDIKWQRMVSHQLPLAQHFGHQELDSHYWLKGILFEPWRCRTTGQTTRQFDWLHLRDAQEYLRRHEGPWQWLTKRRWLSAYHADQGGIEPQQLLDQLKQHFAQATYGIMLANSSTDVQHRCFVVADHWPGAR